MPQEIRDFGKFKTSLGAVLEIIKVSEDKEEMKRLLRTNEEYSHMDNESVAAINTFIGVNIPLNQEKGETDMCKAWDDQRKEDLLKGRKEGRKEGRKKGHREGAEEQRLVAIRNMIKYGVSKNYILQDYSEEEYERALGSQLVQA